MLYISKVLFETQELSSPTDSIHNSMCTLAQNSIQNDKPIPWVKFQNRNKQTSVQVVGLKSRLETWTFPQKIHARDFRSEKGGTAKLPSPIFGIEIGS